MPAQCFTLPNTQQKQRHNTGGATNKTPVNGAFVGWQRFSDVRESAKCDTPSGGVKHNENANANKENK